ncbi:MAG: hypothetical protein ACOX6T_25305 [Myxococcales bacterium]|jgi:hypothetical protein
MTSTRLIVSLISLCALLALDARAEAPAEKSNWKILVKSHGCALVPDDPELLSRMHFHHEVVAAKGKVTITQLDLKKRLEVPAKERAVLERLAKSIDWKGLQEAAAKEIPPDGGVYYTFKVETGKAKLEFVTYRANEQPDLEKLLSVIATVSGTPEIYRKTVSP